MVNPVVGVLFLGKRDDVHCSIARAWCENHFSEVQYFDGVWGDPLPQAARDWQGDLIISHAGIPRYWVQQLCAV
jgi:hypothetical protein